LEEYYLKERWNISDLVCCVECSGLLGGYRWRLILLFYHVASHTATCLTACKLNLPACILSLLCVGSLVVLQVDGFLPLPTSPTTSCLPVPLLPFLKTMPAGWFPSLLCPACSIALCLLCYVSWSGMISLPTDTCLPRVGVVVTFMSTVHLLYLDPTVLSVPVLHLSHMEAYYYTLCLFVPYRQFLSFSCIACMAAFSSLYPICYVRHLHAALRSVAFMVFTYREFCLIADLFNSLLCVLLRWIWTDGYSFTIVLVS